MVLTDIETIKKNEWERRRKLRIQQVRQQSNELANKLRDRIRIEESKQLSNKQQQRNEFFKKWETRRIDKLQKRYHECLEDVGQAHIQAAVQPDINEFLKKEQEINRACATLRGQSALDKLRHEQQKCIESKTIGLQRRKFIRGKEDFRSHLVASLPPPIPIPLARTNSSQSRHSNNNKRISPFKKKKFSIIPKRKKPKVLSEIPSNLPDTTRKQNYFIFTGLSAAQSKSNENNITVESNKVPSVRENQLSDRQRAGEDEYSIRQYTKKHGEDLKIPTNHNSNQCTKCTHRGTDRIISKDNVPLLTNNDINRNNKSARSCSEGNRSTSCNAQMFMNHNRNEASEPNQNGKSENSSEGTHMMSKYHEDIDMFMTGKDNRDDKSTRSCFEESKLISRNAQLSINHNRNEASASNQDHKCENTSEGVYTMTKNYEEKDNFGAGNDNAECSETHGQDPEYFVKCSCSIASMSDSSIDHKCAGYELNFYQKDRIKSPNKKKNDRTVSDNCSSNKHRRRRYSEAESFSDESFDSDVTWPPYSPRTRSHIIKNHKQPASSRVEYYDHNNRFHSTSCRSKPVPFVTKLHHLPSNIASAELERLAVENKVSKEELLNDKQSKRSVKAVERQRLRYDFQKLIDELSKLDKKERKLRYSAMQPSDKGATTFGETQRKEIMANRQKRMESAVESVINSHIKQPEVLHLQKGFDHKNKVKFKHKEIVETEEVPKLNVAECQFIKNDTNPKRKPTVINTNVRELDNSSNNKLSLQNLMKRINEQREMLFNDIKNDNCSKELLLPFSDVEPIPRHQSHKRKEFINHPAMQMQSSNIQEETSNMLSHEQKIRSPSLPLQERDGSLQSEVNGNVRRRGKSPNTDDRDILWSRKISPNSKCEIKNSFENNKNIDSCGEYGAVGTFSPDNHLQGSHSNKSFSSGTGEISSDSLKNIHLDSGQSKTQAHPCILHEKCVCQTGNSDLSSAEKVKMGLIKSDERYKRNSKMEEKNLNKKLGESSKKQDCKLHTSNSKGQRIENNSIEKERKKNLDNIESAHSTKKRETDDDDDGTDSFEREEIKIMHSIETGVESNKKRDIRCSNEDKFFDRERRKEKHKLDKDLKKHEKHIYQPSQETAFHGSDEYEIQHSEGNNSFDRKRRKSPGKKESSKHKEEKSKILGTNEDSPPEQQSRKNPQRLSASTSFKNVQQHQDYDKVGKLKNQCIKDLCKHDCTCKSKQSQINKEKSMQNDTNNFYMNCNDNDRKKGERNIRFPSPIPHCHTDDISIKIHKENCDASNKKLCGNSVDETDKNRDKKSSTSSEETGSTLYSLDMALSQLSMDSSNETSSSSFKGVRIVVKVSGQKQKEKSSKSKMRKIKGKPKEDSTHKELPDNQKQCSHGPFLADSYNQKDQKTISPPKRDQSGGSSSTSYLSPPDQLTPEQVNMLSGLFKKIQTQDDHKGIPLLKQYILRLLNMSRGSIDRLNVSSSDVSISSSIFQDDTVESFHNNIRKENGRYIANETDECHISMRENIKQNQQGNFKCKHDSLRQQKGSERYSEKKEQPPMNQALTKDNTQQTNLQSNLDSLRKQVNEYFERKKDSKVKASLETTDIVNKYAELAKMYAERMNCLVEMIGDLNSSEIIKKSMSCNQNNDTSYLSLPSETHVDVPVGNIEPCGYISPTYVYDNSSGQNNTSKDKSWGRQLNTSKAPENTPATIDLSHISTNISPAPPQVGKCNQPVHPSPCSFLDTKPPPTMLNGKMRICTPHELSTIQEVDTPTTSRIHVTARSQDCHQTSTTDVPDSNANNEIAANEQMIEDINLSFLTLKSQEEEEEEDEDESQECSSAESVPDIMNELIRRGIITSPFSWAKEMNKTNATNENLNEDIKNDQKDNNASCYTEDLSSSQMADEEVRGILKESSPEDIEADFKSLGIGWASTTLRKTRQANELSCDSSSSNDFNSSRTKGIRRTSNVTGKVETSTPDNVRSGNKSGFVRLIPTSEPDLSTVKLSSSSDNLLMLTPPDVSLRPNMQCMTLSNESIGSLS